jgi:hypothetical protein
MNQQPEPQQTAPDTTPEVQGATPTDDPRALVKAARANLKQAKAAVKTAKKAAVRAKKEFKSLKKSLVEK